MRKIICCGLPVIRKILYRYHADPGCGDAGKGGQASQAATGERLHYHRTAYGVGAGGLANGTGRSGIVGMYVKSHRQRNVFREQPVDRQTVITKILQGMEGLRKQADPLVIVTNNVFEDGMIYDDSTMEYIEALGRINERLAAEADEVVEVVAGIPQRIKPGSPGAKAQNRQDSRG